jgi:hypothetical protein
MAYCESRLVGGVVNASNAIQSSGPVAEFGRLVRPREGQGRPKPDRSEIVPSFDRKRGNTLSRIDDSPLYINALMTCKKITRPSDK